MHRPAKGSSARKTFAMSSKLSLSWTGPCKVIYVGPGKTGGGKEVGPKLLLPDTRTDEPGRRMHAGVSVHRCKRCSNPHEGVNAPDFFAMVYEQQLYVLNKSSEIFNPQFT